MATWYAMDFEYKICKINDFMSNYPLGAEFDRRAPWNEPPAIDFDVQVSLTIYKTVTIRTDRYTMDGGGYDIDRHVLEDAVRDQVTLPHELAYVIKNANCKLGLTEANAIADADGWTELEMEVEMA